MRSLMNRKSVRGTLLFLPLLLVALGVGAQTVPGMEDAPPPEPASDEELEDFTVAYLEIQVIQGELEERMVSRLETSDMESERFFEINQMAQESGSAEELPGVAENELDEYEVVLEDLLALQDDVQDRMMDAVAQQELTVERYNEIILLIQQDPALAERAQAYIEEQIGEENESE